MPQGIRHLQTLFLHIGTVSENSRLFYCQIKIHPYGIGSGRRHIPASNT